VTGDGRREGEDGNADDTSEDRDRDAIRSGGCSRLITRASLSLFLSSRHGGERRGTGALGPVSSASPSGLSAVDAAATVGPL